MFQITNVIFDIEATCENSTINPDYEMETIEIGAVKLKNGEIVDTFQTFVKPKLVNELTEYCKKLTGISYNDLKDAPYFEEAILDFFNFIYGSTIYSAGNFDKNMFLKELKEKGNKYIHDLVSDVILYSHKDLKKHYTMVISKPRTGMYGMAEELEVRMEGAEHRALDDALNLSKIFLEIENRRKKYLDNVFNDRQTDMLLLNINEIHKHQIITAHDKGHYEIELLDLGTKTNIDKVNLLDNLSDIIVNDHETGGHRYLGPKELKTLVKFTI